MHAEIGLTIPVLDHHWHKLCAWLRALTLALQCPRKTQQIESLQVVVQDLRAEAAAAASTTAAEIQDLSAQLAESMATSATELLESNLR